MKKYYFNKLNKIEIDKLCIRSAINYDQILEKVRPIVDEVKKEGDLALRKYTLLLDQVKLDNFLVSEKEMALGAKQLSIETKRALKVAYKNIIKFHKKQKPNSFSVETMPGIVCSRESRAIEKVGLYIPSGSAPLPSTVLMLGIPALLAGCKDVVLCTPPQLDGGVAPSILYAAGLCGITQIYKVGGAQAVAAMAYGTESVPKVYKIFGPGNQYVTAAKMLVSIDPAGAAIDMPAGPSEILVVADNDSRADFVAADLLSQAEHSPDSAVGLICISENKLDEIINEVYKQADVLSRKEVALQSVQNGFAVVAENIEIALGFANDYAPEHLLLNIDEAEKYVDKIINAGSVFLGQYACESIGDYASGTNHTLPTYGYARMYSGISVENFMKMITFQKISSTGVLNIATTVMELAQTEGLMAHRRAMEIRVDYLNSL
ncbi:MAG: hypothetical protein ACD_72C00261G0011 [uncultured bacterium]|nr:MAG: hypothetical protein ACD_72C00261G0011 [uncultured bacterium]